MRAGLIAASAFNARREKRTDRYVVWSDFFAEPKRDSEPMDDDEMFATMLAFAKRRQGAAN